VGIQIQQESLKVFVLVLFSIFKLLFSPWREWDVFTNFEKKISKLNVLINLFYVQQLQVDVSINFKCNTTAFKVWINQPPLLP
jgi:hypothetical protein